MALPFELRVQAGGRRSMHLFTCARAASLGIARRGLDPSVAVPSLTVRLHRRRVGRACGPRVLCCKASGALARRARSGQVWHGMCWVSTMHPYVSRGIRDVPSSFQTCTLFELWLQGEWSLGTGSWGGMRPFETSNHRSVLEWLRVGL